MTAESSLDLKGNFREHPFAELLVEIAHARLAGSLRITCQKQKAVVYFRQGAVVYAVANSRALRLFNILLQKKRVEQKDLADLPELANDIKLAAGLVEKGILKKQQIDEETTVQIESILVDVLTWADGEWHFSPLTRLREDLVYPVEVHKVLAVYSRCLPSQLVYERFRSVEEAFYRQPEPPSVVVQPHEKHVLDLFDAGELTIAQLRSRSTLSPTALLQTLYVLWMGGLILRRGWNSAFTAAKLEQINTARYSLVKSASTISTPVSEVEDLVAAEPPTEREELRLPDLQLSLEEYLERVEKGETHYNILGVADDASFSEIKNAYFAMAKLFHPDRFHREEAKKLRRIQVAFTQIANAYETLKTTDGRENYDFKLSKEAEYREKRRAATVDAPVGEGTDAEQGLDNFEKGLDALSDQEFAAAAGHLSRAVHYSPQNALFHAYLGQALSHLERQQHKAEAELQTAVKLEPKNARIRLMLVEFFVEMKMTKRATGELKRFLEIAPGNREAQKMLDDLQAEATT